MDTTHDPIQRWGLEWNTSAGRDFVVPDHQGRYVTYDDHVEAVRQAEQRGREQQAREDSGHTLRAIRAAVQRERKAAAERRVLTADDPEPTVGSVVLLVKYPNVTSTASRGITGWFRSPSWPALDWPTLMREHGPAVLIHDAAIAAALGEDGK